MSNLLNGFKGLLTDNLVGKISSLIGSNSSLTKTALASLAPSMLKGIIDKGSTVSGAQSLLGMIKNDNVDESQFSNMDTLLDKGSGDLMSAGSKMNDALFGSSAKSMTSSLGLGGDSSSKLMNIATPLFMNSLGSVVKKDNLDAEGLKNYLGSQKSHILQSTSSATSRATSAASSAASVERRSGSPLKWLIPLFLLLAAGWFAMQHFGDKKEADVTPAVEETTQRVETSNTASTTANTTSNTATTTGNAATNAAATTTATAATAAGDMADDAKNAASEAAGSYSIDASGNLVDADGKVILKKGEFSEKDGAYYNAEGKKIGAIAKIGKAIGGAAVATADAFKDVFGGMFKKKSSGEVVAAYGLTDVQFDEAHKVVNFSKNEVLGLAAALKAYPDSKIKVQVAGASKKVTKQRAKVVHDWLVTLGISDKQVSAEGLGEGAEKVDIVIE